jgi:hypothetical protein
MSCIILLVSLHDYAAMRAADSPRGHKSLFGGVQNKWANNRDTELILTVKHDIVCWDRAVRVATGYGLDDRGIGVRVFCGPPSILSKWPRREADHSPPTSAEIKKMWTYTSTPPIRLHGSGGLARVSACLMASGPCGPP